MSDENTPSWEEVKKLVGSPHLSDGDKRTLLSAYSLADSVDAPEEEITNYLERYNDVDDYPAYSGDTTEERLEQAYADLSQKHEGEQSSWQQDISDSHSSLERSERAARSGEQGGAGAKTADELLDAGEPGMEFFETWMPVFHGMSVHYSEGAGNVPKLDKIKELYNEQRGLRFDKFAESADSLERAERGARQARQHMSDKLGVLWKSWQGQAAQASEEFFQGKFVPTAQERVAGRVADGAELVRETNKTTAEFVRNKVKTVLGFAEQALEIVGKNSRDWELTIEASNSEDEEVLKNVCHLWADIDMNTGCAGGLDEKARGEIRGECQKIIQRDFEPAIVKAWSELHESCKDTREKIDEAFGELNDVLGEAEEDPFKNPGPAPDSKGDQGGGQQQPNQNPAGGGPQGGDGGGGAPGGGGTPAAQDMPEPPDPQAAMSDTPGSPGESSGSGEPGGPGEPGGLGDPSGPGDPDAPGERGTPAAPQGPGTPGGPGAPGGAEEKVTLGRGDEAVSLSEPKPDGTVNVEIRGENGGPKSYALALGPEGDGPAEPGQQDSGPPLPGQRAPGGPVPEPGGIGQPDGSGAVPGGVPAPDGPGAAGDGPIPVQPGEDGKAVIEEGDRTITVQRAPEGGLAVSVDNGGDQPPLHQTVGFGDADGTPTADSPAQPADGPAQPADPGTGPGGQAPPRRRPPPRRRMIQSPQVIRARQVTQVPAARCRPRRRPRKAPQLRSRVRPAAPPRLPEAPTPLRDRSRRPKGPPVALRRTHRPRQRRSPRSARCSARTSGARSAASPVISSAAPARTARPGRGSRVSAATATAGSPR